MGADDPRPASREPLAAQQAAKAGHRSVYPGPPQAPPQAGLISGHHRPAEILFEGLQNRHAAKTGAGYQYAVGHWRTGGADLLVQAFDI